MAYLTGSSRRSTRFRSSTSQREPKPGSRTAMTPTLVAVACSTFHRPETLAEWSTADHREPRCSDVSGEAQGDAARSIPRGSGGSRPRRSTTLSSRLREDRPRALIQMATGSGKTFTAANVAFRLIRHAEAKRILFLVDRSTLGKQTKLEFEKFVIPDTQRNFPAEYNIQHLTTNTIDTTSRVCISTIQRVFSILKGDQELDPEIDEHSAYELPVAEPVEVEYNPKLPPDEFDIIVIDECHRSIYGLWRQVLEYFDAHLIGLTATPTKQTFGFFNQNLVMEYSHDMAVADGVNVDFTIYKIKTAITESGSKIEVGEFAGYRDRMTRKVRWDAVDEPVEYAPNQLDRAVVAPDQIRLILSTFRDRLFTELFPGRKTVPKTLIFAKDDSHADDVVQMVREVFGKGNEFATKITYSARDGKAEDLLQAFRNSLNPRIVVTVDMIATGTDVRPLECLIFMRTVKSRTYFEQMLGRGVRVMDDTEFQSVTDDSKHKDRFIVVDAVGVTDTDLIETTLPLERKPTTSLKDLMKMVGFGNAEPDLASTIAGRLARLDTRLPDEEQKLLSKLAGGVGLGDIAHGIVEALDPDNQLAAVEAAGGSADDEAAVQQAATQMITEALKPLAENPELRNAILDVQKSFEQTIDEVSKDVLLEAATLRGGPRKGRRAGQLVPGLHRGAQGRHPRPQVLYSRPYRERLTFTEIKELATCHQAATPPVDARDGCGTPTRCSTDRRSDGSGGKMLTDIVSLVRFALEQENELVPFRDQVEQRFQGWLLSQEQKGRRIHATSSFNGSPG